MGSARTRETVGLPGSGLSYTTAHRWRHRAKRQRGHAEGGSLFDALVGLAIMWVFLRTVWGLAFR